MPKIVNHDEYRQALLEKSFHLFTLKGYNNVNMKEIATEIGVSTGTLYHYFPSKEKILAEMISWAGLENTEEYIRRTISIESIKDRFDMIVSFWREKGELYEKILLLGFDMYRNTDINQWKTVYGIFAERYVAGMSERLNISRQFANFIFIYFLGLSFHGIATDSIEEYNKEIDFLDVIFRPLIVDAHEDVDKAAQKLKKIYKTFLANDDVEKTSQRFKEVFKTFLANSLVTEKATIAKKIKSTKIKKAETKQKKAKAKQKVEPRKTQRKQ
jgi:AcrR family transcriptional regulator